MIGQILGNYKILDQVGEGNMGAVYQALDLMLDREVALKALRPELARRVDVVERFREEARVQARLNHPNVAQMYTFFRHGEDLFMVMEFIKGQTFDDMIRSSGRMTLEQALPLFLQALDGLDHAHRLGIVHRDLKPANIMLNRDGLVKVMDFGIARVLGSARMTREGAMIGTLEYMPPERVLGKEMDARSDIYSMGFVLYEMLSGNLPFASKTEYEILKDQIETPPPPIRATVPDIPLDVELAILKAMAKEPEQRFLTAAAFAYALRPAPVVVNPAVTQSNPVIAQPVPIVAEQVPAVAEPPAQTGSHETRFIDSYTPPEPAIAVNVDVPDTFVPETANSSWIPPAKIPQKYYIYGIAGVAVLVAIVLIVLATRGPETPPPTPTTAPAATKPVATPAPAPPPVTVQTPPVTTPPVKTSPPPAQPSRPTVAKQNPRPKSSPAPSASSAEEDRKKLEELFSGKKKQDEERY